VAPRGAVSGLGGVSLRGKGALRRALSPGAGRPGARRAGSGLGKAVVAAVRGVGRCGPAWSCSGARVWRRAWAAAVVLAASRPAHAVTAAAGEASKLPSFLSSLTAAGVLWSSLFIFSSALHAAEISITTLYPWKVREFAEEEGPRSPFQYLNDDITRVLTTILVLTTVSQVVSTVLFTTIIGRIESIGFAKATTILTLFTLFFGELLPKSLGVSNAELVARSMVPIISVFATVFSPMGKSASWLTKKVLRFFGLKAVDDGRVSEEELRLIVMGARQSGGIEQEEAMMVEGVLDLQDTRVSEVMKPRVEVEALEKNATLMDLLHVVNSTHYSRIPIYDESIDKIVGVTIAKDLLSYAADPVSLRTCTVAEVMEPTYFVPESMVVQRVLEEMRRRRLHMAIVVDEYGGTAGVVTLEDILEEVVGEIYDEGDDMEEITDEDNIMMVGEGSFQLRGIADLEDVCLALNMTLETPDVRDFGTISGFLCDQAGEIPAVGDCLLVSDYAFTVADADERRILLVYAELIDNLTSDPDKPFIRTRYTKENDQEDNPRSRNGNGRGLSDRFSWNRSDDPPNRRGDSAQESDELQDGVLPS